jgi:hypothetical protein
MTTIPAHTPNPESRKHVGTEYVPQCSGLAPRNIELGITREHSEIQSMFRITKRLGILCNLLYTSMLYRFRVIPPTRVRVGPDRSNHENQTPTTLSSPAPASSQPRAHIRAVRPGHARRGDRRPVRLTLRRLRPPGTFFGVWSPTPQCVARELGGNPANRREIAYRLCDACCARCERDQKFVATLENCILELWRAGNAHRFQTIEASNG